MDPSSELSGFPLIMCSDCGIARVVEGRPKKDSENHGRLYFKCARNGRNGIILVRPSNWEEVNMSQEEEVDSPNGDKRGDKKGTELEEKMESLIWQMNMFIAYVEVTM
ncbi:unnamed protein product [Miscanthus lutarioriparius]|uniref:Zinc finger GRF-type domain-containing protein n=1 Tax=Miscanthus lutarioriparius TaxID=422564 RepID=A0A811P5Y9_9POAL|nr:unnamed protein product [Miscanthus lutarioriparius]